MQRRTKWIVGAGLAIAVVGGGAGVGLASSDDDGGETAISGSALEKASAAALESTGGGTVTETELRDEEGYYEIGITREDGRAVDVHLDRDFNVIDSRGDGSEHGDQDGSE